MIHNTCIRDFNKALLPDFNSQNSHIRSGSCSKVCRCWLYHEAQSHYSIELDLTSTDKRMTFTDSQNTHDFPLGQSSTAGETNATNEVSAEISQSRQLQQLEPPPPNGDDRGMSPSKESHVLDEDQLRVEEDASILVTTFPKSSIPRANLSSAELSFSSAG